MLQSENRKEQYTASWLNCQYWYRYLIVGRHIVCWSLVDDTIIWPSDCCLLESDQCPLFRFISIGTEYLGKLIQTAWLWSCHNGVFQLQDIMQQEVSSVRITLVSASAHLKPCNIWNHTFLTFESYPLRRMTIESPASTTIKSLMANGAWAATLLTITFIAISKSTSVPGVSTILPQTGFLRILHRQPFLNDRQNKSGEWKRTVDACNCTDRYYGSTVDLPVNPLCCS